MTMSHVSIEAFGPSRKLIHQDIIYRNDIFSLSVDILTHDLHRSACYTRRTTLWLIIHILHSQLDYQKSIRVGDHPFDEMITGFESDFG
jgi:hypothetical protein